MKISALLFSILLLASSVQGQGIRFDKEKYSQAEEWEPDELGFSANLPAKLSLRKYCPPPKLQDGLSCVGWASAYSAMSILHNYMYHITNKDEKELYAFDPYYIYASIKDKYDYDCSEGTYMVHAFKILHENGCKKMWSPDLLSCNSPIENNSKFYAAPFKVKNFYVLREAYRELNNEKRIEMIQSAISYNLPIVVGMNTSMSIQSSRVTGGKVGASGLWDPTSNEESSGLHAMTVIGYDNNKHGGSFELMNSYGDFYGDDGYIWIKYDDFIRLTEELFVIELYNPNDNDYCYLGDCENEYSHFYYEKQRFEGEISDGIPHGFGIHSTYESNQLIYVGWWEKGDRDGRGLLFDCKKHKAYKLTYKNGKLLDSESLGFANSELSEQDKKLQILIDHHKEKGFVEMGDEEDLDDLDLDNIAPINFKK